MKNIQIIKPSNKVVFFIIFDLVWQVPEHPRSWRRFGGCQGKFEGGMDVQSEQGENIFSRTTPTAGRVARSVMSTTSR